MGLFQKAYETYENHEDLVGIIPEDGKALLPVAHIFMNAGLEITIDKEGKFKKAEIVIKNDAKTIIPVTMESGGRSGTNPSAHPLCDKVSYMLKENEDKYDDYYKQLCRWAESAYTDVKLCAVRNYVAKGTIIEDLKRCSVWAEGKGSDEKNKKLLESVVRWRVTGLGENSVAECWKDKNLFSAWEKYYLSIMDNESNLCMISGRNESITENHPKNIVSFNANAKLISANDAKNFTYRGRFQKGVEACSVGYLSSQKAHSVLRWLVEHGNSLFGRSYLCWNPKGKHLPKIWSPIDFTELEVMATPADYKKQVKNALSGFRNDLPDTEDVIIAAIDAATSGRMSITYYNELKASDFFDRIEKWYESCCWNSGKLGIRTPTIYKIVKLAYGVEKDDGQIDANELIFRDNSQRMIKCITDKATMPYDIVRQLSQKASNPQAYNMKYTNYRDLLFVVCAVIRKYYNDRCQKEEWTLTLDKEKVDKDYLFGRLLAIMEKVERDTYDREECREPNAIRMQAAFCKKPFYYAAIIHKQLSPYFAKQSSGRRIYYKNEIGAIMDKLAEFSEAELNKPLNEKYLLGYYLQRTELYKSKKEEIKEED